jgi:hypothetical protein
MRHLWEYVLQLWECYIAGKPNANPLRRGKQDVPLTRRSSVRPRVEARILSVTNREGVDLLISRRALVL